MTGKSSRDSYTYNYPLKRTSKSPKVKSTTGLGINNSNNNLSKSPTQFKSNLKSNVLIQNTSKHTRNASVDNVVDKKTKCIEKMESNVKNYFDQTNTKNELKDLTNSINSNFDKINNNLMNSKESLNISNVSNVFEKHSNNSKYNNFNKEVTRNSLLEQTPQFNDIDEGRNINGFVVNDYEKCRVSFLC
jgi:hypothetical protein